MSADGPIFHKFNVTRTDGTDAPGRKHDGCFYFVLDVDHDPHARPALSAYAESCHTTHPTLAADIRRLLIETDRPIAEPPIDIAALVEEAERGYCVEAVEGGRMVSRRGDGPARCGKPLPCPDHGGGQVDALRAAEGER